MIRHLILVTAVAFSFCSAQADHDDLTNRLYDRSDRVQSLIRQNAHRLDEQSQRQILEHLRAIENLASQGDRPAPYPGPGPGPSPRPIPGPLPPPPPSQLRQSVRGDIESKVFNFEVMDLLDLHNQCTSFVAQQVGSNASVDDINVSINYGPSRTLRNSSSYWKGEAHICAQIEEVARGQGLTYRGPWITYTGTIESTSFMFSAVSIADLGRQCDEFVNRNGISSVDDITVSVNLGPLKTLRNSSSYWKNSFEICQQILQQR